MAKKKQDYNIEFPEQKIIPVNMEKNVQKSFIEYSMSVIVSRALPDARDGMKPGQRRVLYAMWEDNLTYDKPFRKSATTVGIVLGRYHPHGDSSVYGTMVRMAQPFSYRYTLVDGHGNFGSVDGDGPAAYRYTEARLSKLSEEMLRDIEKETIKWDMNFDNTRKEPSVLPSRFPNLLVNGAIGIAVGMATNIPPHNLGEVVDGTIHLMENPDASVQELMQFIKGPDFPTGAEIHGTMGILEAYSTGRGRIMVRAKAEVDDEKNAVIITEIPYMVQKSELIKSMADQVKDKRIDGVTDIRDESGRDGMRIVIECRRDANPNVILNQFYKYTELESTCAVTMLALVGNEPKVLNLRQVLQVYIRHQESVITNRVKFDLEKALHEAHINEGYKIATDNIDEVITIIRNSADTPEAKTRLCDRFSLSEEQATAIVQMTLGRLSGLERQKVIDKLNELYATIADLRSILGDENRIKQIIKEELLDIKKRFSDERRTRIEEVADEIVPEDLIERYNAVITLTNQGYIKRQPSDTYSAQRRGGKGIIGMTTKEEDFIEKVAVADSHSNLMLFTDRGVVFQIKAYRVPEAGRTAKGSNIVNLIETNPGEKITAMLSVPDFNEKSKDVKEDETYVVMITKHGLIKRVRLEEFRFMTKKGKRALQLVDDDSLIFVTLTHGNSDICVVTRNGYGVRYEENNIRVMGRTARGVKAIKLTFDDVVAGACIIERDEEWNANNTVLLVTDRGYGKRILASDIPMKGRAARGVVMLRISEQKGRICGISVVSEDKDIMIITNDGNIIRTPAYGVNVYSRYATGVKVMRLNEDNFIANFTIADKDETAETAAPVEPEELEEDELLTDIEIDDEEDTDESDEGVEIEEAEDSEENEEEEQSGSADEDEE